MNFDLKNTIIIILFLYLISGNILKVFMGTTKALIYLVIFFMVISKISPDLYSKIGETFNLKNSCLSLIASYSLNSLYVLSGIPSDSI